jgi:ABC-type uncharacterized transport system substrate-binding protein
MSAPFGEFRRHPHLFVDFNMTVPKEEEKVRFLRWCVSIWVC